MKQKKPKSIEVKRRRYGFIFVTHWIFGLVAFFAYPLVSSLIYAFSNVEIVPGAIVTNFVGFENFNQILNADPDYVNNLRDALGNVFYSLPVIIALSLILAVTLNQKFKGRTFVRVIFFLPVIIVGSVVMKRMAEGPIYLPIIGTSESGMGIIDYQGIIGELKLPEFFSTIMIFLLEKTMSLVWSCGVQIILFLAGLQSIPASFYEVSKIEGANKWEEFWFITVPSLRSIISLVLIYTMIDIFTDMNNKLVTVAYSKMTAQDYGLSSAMLWFYFAIVLVAIGAVFYLYNRFCMKKWE